MKRSVSLYIADTKVDLDDASLILFNYTKDDLTNPTVVKNSYSHTVKLKGTPTNNKLFGEIFRLDRQTLYSDQYKGAFFDPMRKTPFKIFDETLALLESGYVKLTNVTKNNGKIEYSITLYGGIGSFFYSLSYTEDGNTRTLADMKFVYNDGSVKKLNNITLNKTTLQSAWSYLKDPSMMPGHCWDIINFAPCYNGLPSDFDANKALCKGYFTQFLPQVSVDGVNYVPKEGCTSRLVTMTNKHTEWEVRNIRPYLQRPVVRIKAIFESIQEWAKENGFTFELDPDFFNESNPMYWDSWITLPIVKKDHRYSNAIQEQILKSSLSPLEYMVSYAKSYNLRFLYDSNHIRLVTPKTFFKNEIVDVGSRIDSTTVEIQPLISESKWYMFGDKVVGEQAEKYKEAYGSPCGSQKVNTGYEFNSEIKSLTKDIKFTDATDVAERSFLYAGYFLDFAFIWAESFAIALHEGVKQQLFKEGTEDSEEFDVLQGYIKSDVFDQNNPYADWLPKVQLHSEDNKALDGSGVLVLFNGVKSVPHLSGPVKDYVYFLSDDHPDQETLNSGTPCWNLDSSLSIALTELPSFRRHKGNYSADWGIPQEYYTKDIPSTVKARYDRYWKNYIADLYSGDTSVLKCKVNLRGLQVGQDLLRKFYWYGGSIWALNKISNYSITTFDLAECEFVKVQDMDNYINGQEL